MSAEATAKILALMGSPRKRGNAAILLAEALKGAELAGAGTETILAADIKNSPCLACGGCERDGKCVINDSMQPLYPKLEEADGIIFATPIFFMGLPAQLKAIVDRCQPFWARKYLLSKPVARSRPGMLIAVGGTDLPHTFDAIRLEVKSLFHCLNVKYETEILVRGVSKHGEVSDRPEVLAEARRAGEAFAREALSWKEEQIRESNH